MEEKDEIEQYFDGSCKFYLFENGTYLPYLGILTEEQALSTLKTVFGHVDLGMMHKSDGKQITWFNGTLCAISSDQSDESAFVSRENLFKDLKNPKIIKHIGE